MKDKPLGGRGIKAPYTSSVRRIPDPIVDKVDQMVENYRHLSVHGTDNDCDPVDVVLSQLGVKALSFEDALRETKRILSRKKSARYTAQKILQVIYQVENVEL